MISVQRVGQELRARAIGLGRVLVCSSAGWASERPGARRYVFDCAIANETLISIAGERVFFETFDPGLV